jgi:DNA-directed RNA polymerase subunit H (RpoH/RPB5)
MELLYLAKSTQSELVEDRGYLLSSLDIQIRQGGWSGFSRWAFSSGDIHRDLSGSYSRPDGQVLHIYYMTRGHSRDVSIASLAPVMQLAEQYRQQGLQQPRIMVIADGSLSAPAHNRLLELPATVELFHLSELTYNVTRHVDCPVHHLLTEEETTVLLQELRTPASKLPIIKATDPVVRYYGWPLGRVVAIDRDDSELNLLAPLSRQYRVIS